MKKICSFTLLLLAIVITSLRAQEVSITDNKFTVEDKEIWFNGINTPWYLFVDFGRSDFDYDWWEEEFERYADNNINLARVWIHCSGEVSPDITDEGYVTGASDLFWEHMDYLMEVSRNNRVYVMPALFSFDITKNTYSKYEQWRAFLNDTANVQSYIDNVLIPLLQRYEDEPYLLGWEICNEPEWMFELDEHGPQSFDVIQRFHAMLAAAVHKNSDKPVTTGSAAPKWNSPIYDDWGEYEGNMFSDEALSASIDDEDAYLDFYQYHWYAWQTEWMSSPYQQTTEEYGVDDRPVIVGESEGNDVCDDFICQTLVEMYENAYLNGFDGVCAWKTPQNDGHGTFENIAVATNAFYSNYPLLVYPDVPIDTVYVTGISLSEDSLSIEQYTSYELSASIEPSNATERDVVWASTDTSVATVDSDGLVTGVDLGTATITVTTVDGGFQAICEVVVVENTGSTCDSPEAKSLPLNINGAGEYCYQVSGDISYVNSWNVDVIEINGVDYSNTWSNSFPDKVNDSYYIYYKAEFDWSHFEAVSASSSRTANTAALDIADEALEVSIYPNPSGSAFTIKVDDEADLQQIQVYNTSGQLVLQQTEKELEANGYTFGGGLPSGVYLVRIERESNPVVLRVIKE